MKYLIIFLILFASCKNPAEVPSNKTTPASNTLKGELLPINRSIEPFNNVHLDTITPDGWKIEYLVKNDSTKYHDIYIRISKDNTEKISRHSDALDMRPYFVPSYKMETDKYILFEHGCATDCSAVTIIPKDNKNKPIEFEFVLKYDMELSTVVFVNTKTFINDIPTISAYNLDENIEKSVTFKNRCISTSPNKCISDIAIKNKKIELTGWFYDGDNSIKETQTIRF
jgi:hypothetical protein